MSSAVERMAEPLSKLDPTRSCAPMSSRENHESGPVPTPVEPPRPATPAGAFVAVPTTLARPPVTPMPSPAVEPSAPHPSAASDAIARVLARAPTPPPMPGGSSPPAAASLSTSAPPATVMIARPTPSAPASSSGAPSRVASASGSASTAASSSVAALSTAASASGAPSPVVDDGPGPITLRSRAFFREADARGPDRSDELPFAAPPLVPLPKRSSRPALDHAEMSGGVLVIHRTSTAWIATAIVIGAGLVVALLLGLDRASTREALAKSQAEVAALTTKLADAEAAATKPAMVLGPKGATASVPADDVTKPIADAFGAAFKREIARGDAKVVVDGARVKLVLHAAVLFDAKKTSLARRADGVIDRLRATLQPLPHRVDVIAHSDGAAGRGKSEWSQTAARATAVVRALESSGIARARLAAVGRGFAEPRGKSASANRRLEIVVAAR